MSDEAAFLKAICDQPGDDTARLVYADWLDDRTEERGEPTPCPRAEFIRVQCELARREDEAGWLQLDAEANALIARDAELLEENELNWCGPGLIDVVAAAIADHVANGLQLVTPGWRRGFVDHIACVAAAWLAYGDTILLSHPVSLVTLTSLDSGLLLGDCLLVQIDGHENRWRALWTGREYPAGSFRWPGVTFELPRLTFELPPSPRG